jgi:predicted alpha/beta superfamily hydrolase
MNRKIITHHIKINHHDESRRIRVVLPHDYDKTHHRYPCLYMHDGQNLLFDNESFSQISWGVIETLDRLSVSDLIIVAIDNAKDRILEYSPWVCSDEIALKTGKIGGKGDDYADFVVHQLKPWMDRTYRTHPDYLSTMIAGSSLGAYISCYIATKYPNIFSIIGVFSLASWFNEVAFLRHLLKSNMDPDQRYFIVIGDHESSSDQVPNFNHIYLNNSRNLKRLLEKKGVKDIFYQEVSGIHHETTWRKSFVDFINWIYKKV